VGPQWAGRVNTEISLTTISTEFPSTKGRQRHEQKRELKPRGQQRKGAKKREKEKGEEILLRKRSVITGRHSTEGGKNGKKEET